MTKLSAIGRLRTVLDAGLGILYPASCAGCGIRLDRWDASLCPECRKDVDTPDPNAVLAQPASLQTPCPIDAACALWWISHVSPLRKIHHSLKYGNRPWYGPALGRQMAETFRSLLAQYPLDVVAPIPLHRARYLERGYNQSALLAEGVGAALGLHVHPHVLVRHRATRSQTSLSKAERLKNVASAFTVSPGYDVKGRRVLLVDDLLTTGGTAVSAATTLKDAGASCVVLATLGIAEP